MWPVTLLNKDKNSLLSLRVHNQVMSLSNQSDLQKLNDQWFDTSSFSIGQTGFTVHYRQQASIKTRAFIVNLTEFWSKHRFSWISDVTVHRTGWESKDKSLAICTRQSNVRSDLSARCDASPAVCHLHTKTSVAEMYRQDVKVYAVGYRNINVHVSCMKQTMIGINCVLWLMWISLLFFMV